MPEYVVAITGASGCLYARRVIQGILQVGYDIACVVSAPARQVLAMEEGVRLVGRTIEDTQTIAQWVEASASTGKLTMFAADNIAARIASGSAQYNGMVVVPCSGGTLGRVAHGISSGLIERTAEVCLKERRPLVLVTRESPISLVHVNNLQSVLLAGALVVPASPGFYNNPRTIIDLVDMIAGRVLNLLGIENMLSAPWIGTAPSTGQDTCDTEPQSSTKS